MRLRVERIRRCVCPLCGDLPRRDLFVPAAARFATGVEPEAAGPAVPVADLVRLPVPLCRVGPGLAETEVLTADGFGNLQLALPAARAAEAGFGVGVRLSVSVWGRAAMPLAVPVVATFAPCPPASRCSTSTRPACSRWRSNRGSASRQLGSVPALLSG